MVRARLSAAKSQDEIGREWDRLAAVRAKQIETGVDLSYNLILAPTMLSLIRGANLSSVLDVGCGSGDLTHRLASMSGLVLGIDISEVSVKISRERWRDSRNLRFVASS